MKTTLLFPALAIALGSSACDKDKKPADPAPPPSTSEAQVALSASSEEAPPPVPSPASPGIITTWRKDMGMKAPASVLHDEAGDVYLVSNVDGKPLEADGKGFISRWDSNAVGGDTKWIDSGKNGVTLNAPKGMAITGETLWVADIDTVRMFDRKSGRPTGEVKIAGASFLNAVAVLADGRVIVADRGMKAGSGDDFEPAETDAVHVISRDKKVATFAKHKELGNPNGLLVVNGTAWVASWSGQIFSLGASGLKNDVTRLPKGKLDGLAKVDDDFLVSSWEASGIYRGQPGGQEWKLVLEGVKGPAGFTVDRKRKRLIVPVMEEDELRAYKLE